ncbi:MAG: IclR family transcriptional regulator [Beijerinckiaceae bacterium]
MGETVDLAVLSGGSVVFVDQVQGRQRLVALSAVGERFPLHCTANGKAILSCFSEADADGLIARSLAEHPGHPLKDRKRLLGEIEAARVTHLAIDLGEHGEGICAIGMAMLDGWGRPVAISIPVPQQRFADARPMLEQRLLAFRETIRPVIAR